MKSTSCTRRLSSSPIRSPRPACAITIAWLRAGIAVASSATWATLSGTTRSRWVAGSDSRTTGDEATNRSSTAEAYTDRSRLTRFRRVVGASTCARSEAQACTSEGVTTASRRAPKLVPAMCVWNMLNTRRAVVGRWMHAAAHLVAYSRTVVRSNGSMYWPRCRSTSICETERWASILRGKDRLRWRPLSSRHLASQVAVPSRSRFSMLATSGGLGDEPGPHLVGVVPHMPPDAVPRRTRTDGAPVVDRRHRHAEELGQVGERPQALARRQRRGRGGNRQSSHRSGPFVLSGV